MENTENQQKVSIGNKEYTLEELDPQVVNLLTVYTKWDKDREACLENLSTAKLEVAKIEAAIRDLANEINLTQKAYDDRDKTVNLDHNTTNP